jgi:Protein of unknown function (DUF2971)
LLQEDKLYRDKFYRDFGIYSLSAQKNNFLLWSHYSNSHEGFCIGFNSKKLFKQAQGHLGGVTYSKNFPSFKLFDDAIIFFIKYAFYKASIWSYEQEFRLMISQIPGKVMKLNSEIFEEIILGNKMKQTVKFEIIDLVKTNFPGIRIYDTILDKNKFELNLIQIY